MKKYLISLAIGLTTIIGLTLLCDSCTTDTKLNKGDTVNIHLGLSSSPAVVAEVRSNTLQTPTTKLTDNISLSATIVEDNDTQLRWNIADTILHDDSRVLIIIDEAGAGSVHQAMYTYKIATKSLVLSYGPNAGTYEPIPLTVGKTYVVTAYTDYSNSPNTNIAHSWLTTNSFTDVSKLVYGVSTVTVTPDTEYVLLTLKPVANAVKYIIRQYNGDNLTFSDCELTDYTRNNFSHVTGEGLVCVGENPEILGGHPGDVAQWNLEQEADTLHSKRTSRILKPGITHPVSINNITIHDALSSNTKVFNNIPIVLTKPLNTDRDYTIYINVIYKPEPIFAASNIYYSVEKQRLTFDAELKGDNQLYQGVYFKYGSLVGISPVGSPAGGGVSIFTPNYTDIHNHDYTLSSVATELSYTAIPVYMGDRLDTVSYTNQLGDICQYISSIGDGPAGNWRTPTLDQVIDLISAPMIHNAYVDEYNPPPVIPPSNGYGAGLAEYYFTGNNGDRYPVTRYRKHLGDSSHSSTDMVLSTSTVFGSLERSIYSYHAAGIALAVPYDKLNAVAIRCVLLP
jgi:hypothetical protein